MKASSSKQDKNAAIDLSREAVKAGYKYAHVLEGDYWADQLVQAHQSGDKGKYEYDGALNNYKLALETATSEQKK